MRGFKVPQAPPRSARPPHRAGAFATYQAIDNAGVFGWHKVRSTEVAAPTRRSGTARLISETAKVSFRPIQDIRPSAALPLRPEHRPSGARRQPFHRFGAKLGIAVVIEARRPNRHPCHPRHDRPDPAAYAALARQADAKGIIARPVIMPAGNHQRVDPSDPGL